MYWHSSIPRDELAWLLLPFVLLDGLRYFLTVICVWLVDTVSRIFESNRAGDAEQKAYGYCPSVSVVVAGLNEGENLWATLKRLWGSYPRLEMIVVDDGSTDNMAAEARRFASQHANVSVISRRRGGKSSAMNAGLAVATGEVTVIMDADSEPAPNAIWEIVQPLADPSVGAVSGNVRVRNARKNLLTRIQSFEYLRSVFLGKIVASKLGILGIVSGAFGAFPTSLLRRIGGWDVGPAQDEDLILRIRKLGYRIEFARYADCFTDVPESIRVLTKQRRRWEWAVVTFASRKHIDMANPFARHFRIANFVLFTERWLFNFLLPLWFWVYLPWLIYTWNVQTLGYVSILLYWSYVLCDLIKYLIILDYSRQPRHDAEVLPMLFVMPFYQLSQRVVTTVAIAEEIFTRRSFRDSFVPQHVRKATWHW
jgi:cellulose synthase/poly-beta-1,6-N-acetylglucosamine synthase-like glycosyltransferase